MLLGAVRRLPAQPPRRALGGYLGQTFAGVRCTNGDDLHLTSLVLATGHQVLFEPRAIASTSVPRSLGQYLRQQLRQTTSTGSCAGPSPASGPGTPTWPWTCSPGALLPLLLAAALVLLVGEGLLAG